MGSSEQPAITNKKYDKVEFHHAYLQSEATWSATMQMSV